MNRKRCPHAEAHTVTSDDIPDALLYPQEEGDLWDDTIRQFLNQETG